MELELKHILSYPKDLQFQYTSYKHKEAEKEFFEIYPNIKQYGVNCFSMTEDLKLKYSFLQLGKIRSIENSFSRIKIGNKYPKSFGVNQLGVDVKPILRKLDLTKEIEVNGEKFVPIIYLAKIQYPNVDFQIIENECVGRLNCGVVLEFYIEDEIPFYKEFHNNIFGQTKGNDFDDMFLANIKPSEIREKLLEWHFNLFDLPENLFVDINTLER